MVRKKLLIGLAVAGVVGAGAFYGMAELHDVDVSRKLVFEAVARLRDPADTITAFHKKHGRLPKDAAEAGIQPDGGSLFVREIRYAAGELTAVIRGVPRHEGKTVSLKPRLEGAGLRWSCSADGFGQSGLPQSCRTD